MNSNTEENKTVVEENQEQKSEINPKKDNLPQVC